MTDPQTVLFPETLACGFSAIDGTVQFYLRVKSLVGKEQTVLDLGAGRGAAFSDDVITFRKSLRNFKGFCAEVIGYDLDPVVLENPSLDRAFVIQSDGRLDLTDESIDIIICDFVFEHIPRPHAFVEEINRVLRPGGWVCARTPNKWGYIAIVSRLIRERLYELVLSIAQPNRMKKDVFPTKYLLNSMSALSIHFPKDRWKNFSYMYNSEPAYFGHNVIAWRIALLFQKLLPLRLSSTIMVFLQKIG